MNKKISKNKGSVFSPLLIAIFCFAFAIMGTVGIVKGYSSQEASPIVMENVAFQVENFFSAGDSTGGLLGGTTSDDWNVEGNLRIDGTSTLTGAVTMAGALSGVTTIDASGATDVLTFTQGGGVTASSTSDSTATLLATDFDTESYIAYTVNGANCTLTLPATSTLSAMIPNTGDFRTIFVQSATTTDATTLTFVAGAGMDIQEPDGQDLVIEGNDWARIDFLRLTNTDMVVWFDNGIEAD